MAEPVKPTEPVKPPEPPKPKEININSLRDKSVFTPIQCDFWAENCAVVLDDCGKKAGDLLSVLGDKKLEFSLVWTSPKTTKGYKEIRDVLKFGAVAMSCFIAIETTEYQLIEESPQGTGFDYWMGYHEAHPDYDADNFVKARLEISGMKVESKTNTIDIRIRQKSKQTKKTDYIPLPAYVSIVEFQTPKIYFAKVA